MLGGRCNDPFLSPRLYTSPFPSSPPTPSTFCSIVSQASPSSHLHKFRCSSVPRYASFFPSRHPSARFFLHKQQVINQHYGGRSYLRYLVQTPLFSRARVPWRGDSSASSSTANAALERVISLLRSAADEDDGQ